MALVLGDPGAPRSASRPLPVRVHSSCVTSECLLGLDCDCAEQLDAALAAMARAGGGVLYYLMQEGRGAGLTAKARDRMLVQASGRRLTTFEAYAELGLPPDLRRYDGIAPISRMLGVRGPVALLTNNPEKSAAVAKALAEAGVEVADVEPVRGATSAFNADYLGAKQDSGHALDPGDTGPAVSLPAPVPILPPVVVGGERDRILTAAYLLPVGLDDAVVWLRAGVVYDGATARESVVLARPEVSIGEGVGRGARSGETDAAVRMSLADRLPLERSPGREALRARLRDLGAGRVRCVHVDFDDRDRVAG